MLSRPDGCRRESRHESSSADGRRVTFSLDGTGATAGELVAWSAAQGALRDISILEPEIEDVIARLYAGAVAPAPPAQAAPR